MKRKLCSLLLSIIMVCLMTSPINIQAQEIDEHTLSDFAVMSNIQPSTTADEWIDPYTGEISFPIIADSPEWKEMNSHDEMLEACAIPNEILESISTEELVDLLLDYPLLCDIYAYNSYQEGLQALAADYNGINELLSREDGAEKLIDKYTQLNITQLETSQADLDMMNSIFDEYDIQTAISTLEQNEELYDKVISDSEFVAGVVVLETFLGQDEILEKFSDEEIETLISEVEENYHKKENSELYEGVEDAFFDTVEDSEIISTITSKTLFSLEDSWLEEAILATTQRTVKTPKGSTVTVYQYDYSGASWAASVNAEYKKKYPNATIKGNADNRYNCHSYAWHNPKTTNIYWMNDPTKYMTDGSYTKVGSSPTANNQKVVWYTVALKVPYEHSGIVTNYSSKTIISKWGKAPLMQHSVSYSPYAASTKYYYK